jgi:hypothetical protein
MELPDDLNPGVKKLVVFLNESGFRTVDSGDGATHTYGCDRDHAYVVISVPPQDLIAECFRLLVLLSSRGVSVVPVNPNGLPCVQATYDPADKSAFLDLMNVTDKDLVG